MKRIALTDDSGKWFDGEKAVKFEENTRWNGNNHISIATGSQWEHQSLYYTKSGNWVLHHWSQWQGSLDTYEEVDLGFASKWMTQNSCMDDPQFNDLPEDVQDACNEKIEAAEL